MFLNEPVGDVTLGPMEHVAFAMSSASAISPNVDSRGARQWVGRNGSDESGPSSVAGDTRDDLEHYPEWPVEMSPIQVRSGMSIVSFACGIVGRSP